MENFVNFVENDKILTEKNPILDAYETLKIKVNMNKMYYSQALQSLSNHCFPTYAKARDDLINLWNLANEGKALQEKQKKYYLINEKIDSNKVENSENQLTTVEKHQVRVNNPVPDNIGCQYAAKVLFLF